MSSADSPVTTRRKREELLGADALMGDATRTHAHNTPTAIAVVFREQEIDYRSLHEQILRLANGLLNLRLQPGDRVALLVPNRPEYIVCFHAILVAGCVAVPVNVKSNSNDVHHVLADSGARALIAWGELFAAIDSLATAPAALRHLIVAGTHTACPAAGGAVDDVEVHTMATLCASQASEPPVTRTADDAAVIWYTSGTTGTPKGVVCSHRNCLSAVRAWASALQMTSASRCVMVTPFFHNAYNAFVYALHLVGGTAIVLDSFLVPKVLSAIQAHRPTHLFATPSSYINLLNVRDLTRFDLSSVKKMIYGAAPMPREIIRTLTTRFDCELYNAYAQSETCPAISFLRPEFALSKAPSVGKAVGNVRITVSNDTGGRCGPGEVGEICVRGDNVMLGYHGLPQDTERKLVNGWLHTGDLGYLDADGFLYLVDRKDDLIICAGENIYPNEVEEVLFQHAEVLDAAVVGVADRVHGEVVAAFVVARAGTTLKVAQLRRFCRSRLSPFKVPRRIHLVESLPRNASGKVMRHRLGDAWLREHGHVSDSGHDA